MQKLLILFSKKKESNQFGYEIRESENWSKENWTNDNWSPTIARYENWSLRKLVATKVGRYENWST